MNLTIQRIFISANDTEKEEIIRQAKEKEARLLHELKQHQAFIFELEILKKACDDLKSIKQEDKIA